MKKFLIKIALFTLLMYTISWLAYFMLRSYEREYYHKGIKTRWSMNLHGQHVDYLFLGSSRMANTIAGHQFDSALQVRSLNIATAGSSYGENYVLFYQYLQNGNTAKTLVLSLDLFKSYHSDYDKEALTTLVFKKFDLFPLYADPEVRAVYREHSRPVNMSLWDAIPFSRYAEYNSYFKFDDLVKYTQGRICIPTFDTLNGEQLVHHYTFDGKLRGNPAAIQMGPRGKKYLEKILSLAKANNINVILVTAPYHKMIELDRSFHLQYVNYLKTKYGVEYFDFSVREEWNNKSYFTDAIHTNDRGSRIFTKLLADRLISRK